MPVTVTLPCFLCDAEEEDSIDESQISALTISNCELMSEVCKEVSRRFLIKPKSIPDML